MKRVALILLGIALAASLAAVIVVAGTDSSGAPALVGACHPGDQMLSLSVDGDRHEALMHVPPDARGRLPLVLAFHGAYDTARGTTVYYGLSRLADREQFAVLYPQASHGRPGGRVHDEPRRLRPYAAHAHAEMGQRPGLGRGALARTLHS